jgi:hypothetical protein
MTNRFASTNLWDRNTPLFLYGNEEKLDDLLTRAYGDVVTQFQTAHKEGGKAMLKLAAKLGGFLSALGLGEASAELAAEVSTEKTKTIIATRTFEGKLNALQSYALAQEGFPYIDSFRGLKLERSAGTVAEWKGSKLVPKDCTDRIGQLLGLYRPRRLHPPGEGNLVDDFMNHAKSLWLFEAIPESAIPSRIPILTSNTRLQSQHALVTFLHSLGGNFKIECLGLIHWDGDIATCDPVAWRVFH